MYVYTSFLKRVVRLRKRTNRTRFKQAFSYCHGALVEHSAQACLAHLQLLWRPIVGIFCLAVPIAAMRHEVSWSATGKVDPLGDPWAAAFLMTDASKKPTESLNPRQSWKTHTRGDWQGSSNGWTREYESGWWKKDENPHAELLDKVVHSDVSSSLKKRISFAIASARLAHIDDKEASWVAGDCNEKVILASYRLIRTASLNAGVDLYSLGDILPTLHERVSRQSYRFIHSVHRRNCSLRHQSLSFMAMPTSWSKLMCALEEIQNLPFVYLFDGH